MSVPDPIMTSPPFGNSPGRSSGQQQQEKQENLEKQQQQQQSAMAGTPPTLTSTATVSQAGAGATKPPATGSVRWCMNIALQSFTGEPWAVQLQPTSSSPTGGRSGVKSRSASLADDDLPAGAAAAARQPAKTTTASTNMQNNTVIANESKSNSTIFGGRKGGSTAASRVGIELVPVEYDHGEFTDGSLGSFAQLREEQQVQQQCLEAVNDPPITFSGDELLSRITSVEFMPTATFSGNDDSTLLEEGQLQYHLRHSIDGMLHATLQPAVTAVMDHCVNAMVLVYGATQEMKQMGLIGTPEDCGLLPHGIRLAMERYLERKSPHSGNTARHSASPECSDSLDRASPGMGGFVIPNIGTRSHSFVRAETTFIAFDSSTVVDLLDLKNRHVELVLKLAPPPTPSAFEGDGSGGDGEDSHSGSGGGGATTDAFVLNAKAMPADGTNDALSALDVGLENLSKALEGTLLQSESGSSLLFSLTAYTNNGKCATLHVFCLAEDPAAQSWLASTVLARSQAIPLGEEQSWTSILNTPMPPPLHHHAATLLVPALCFGNMFTSVLLCVYNSITALDRLNRDLTFAVTGYRMRTIPRVTQASSRRSPQKLPPGWEEHFTDDGRRYFIDTTTHTTTWDDPRLVPPGGSSSGSGDQQAAEGGELGQAQRPTRVGLEEGDRDFLSTKLQAQKTTTAAAAPAASASTKKKDEAVNIGIVVIDTQCRPRVLLNTADESFSQQCVREAEVWARQRQEQAERDARDEQERRELAAAEAQEQQEMNRRKAARASPAAAGSNSSSSSHHSTNPSRGRTGETATSSVSTSRFYQSAMQEQIAMPPHAPTGTSVSTSTPLPAAVCSAAEGGPTSTVSIPPDMQDLESLVEEFGVFFRRAIESQRRVKELEATVADLRRQLAERDQKS